MMRRQMQRLKAGDRFGAYKLERKLGLGGMAEVWLASPSSDDRRYPYVVVKRVHAHLTQNMRLLDMFLDEARLAARLNHPNVVRVLDAGLVAEDLFIAMEL